MWSGVCQSWGYLMYSDSHWFYFSRKHFKKDGAWEPHNGNRVHYFGANWEPHPLLYLLCVVPGCLHHHHIGQCQHNHANQKKPSASHPHVPFAQPFGICRHWVLLISHTHHAEGLSQKRNIYPCVWLCGSTLFCSDIWVNWVLPAGCHGLWSLCSHLLTPALLHSHVSQGLPHLIGYFLCGWMCKFFIIHQLFAESDFLWTK